MDVSGPLISVIIPTYNRAGLLSQAIDSVLRQTYRKFECIVVDDGSTDDTGRTVRKFNDNRIIYLRHDTNRHVSTARNTGIMRAQGDLFAFLDDDDEWLPKKLEKQIVYIQKCSESVGMIYCWMDYYDEHGELIKKHHPTLRGHVFPHVLDRQRIGGCPTLLVRRAVIEKVKGFDESLQRGNDGDFIRRVCLEYEVDFVPEVLVKVHTGHGHDRISLNDVRGIQNAIKSQEIKLTKFKEHLHKYPQKAANIYASIAFHHSQLHDWHHSMIYYKKAFGVNAFSKRIYWLLLLSLREAMRNKISTVRPTK